MNGITRQKLLYIDNNVVTIFSNVCIIIFVDNIRNRKRVHSASTKLGFELCWYKGSSTFEKFITQVYNESYGVSNYAQLL